MKFKYSAFLRPLDRKVEVVLQVTLGGETIYFNDFYHFDDLSEENLMNLLQRSFQQAFDWLREAESLLKLFKKAKIEAHIRVGTSSKS